MRVLRFVLFFAIVLVAFSAEAQESKLPVCIVATLDACTGGAVGAIGLSTDSLTATDCTVGGGSSSVICVKKMGGAWSSGGGGGPGGAPVVCLQANLSTCGDEATDGSLAWITNAGIASTDPCFLNITPSPGNWQLCGWDITAGEWHSQIPIVTSLSDIRIGNAAQQILIGNGANSFTLGAANFGTIPLFTQLQMPCVNDQAVMTYSVGTGTWGCAGGTPPSLQEDARVASYLKLDGDCSDTKGAAWTPAGTPVFGRLLGTAVLQAGVPVNAIPDAQDYFFQDAITGGTCSSPAALSATMSNDHKFGICYKVGFQGTFAGNNDILSWFGTSGVAWFTGSSKLNWNEGVSHTAGGAPVANTWSSVCASFCDVSDGTQGCSQVDDIMVWVDGVAVAPPTSLPLTNWPGTITNILFSNGADTAAFSEVMIFNDEIFTADAIEHHCLGGDGDWTGTGGPC